MSSDEAIETAGFTKEPPINEWQAGTVLYSGTISQIIAQSKNFVFYRLEGKRGWSYRLIGVREASVNQAITKLSRIKAKADKKLKSTTDGELDGLIINTMINILNSGTAENFEDDINLIDQYVKDLKEVKAVIGYDENFMVWISHDDDVKYSRSSKISGYEQGINEYTRLKALANAVLSQEQKIAYFRRLGATLCVALRSSQSENLVGLFKPLEDYINGVIANDLRIKYLAVTSISAIILIAVSYIIYYEASLHQYLKTSLIVVCGGFLGTLISVFERSKNLIISDNESTSLIILQGGMRVIIGGVFGLIAYSAAMSGLAFSIFKEGLHNLIILGVAAGFSERLIPDLIQGFSNSTASNDKN